MLFSEFLHGFGQFCFAFAEYFPQFFLKYRERAGKV